MSEQKGKNSIIECVLTLMSASQEANSAKTQSERDNYLEIAYEIQEFLDEIPGGFLIYHASGGEEILYANTALIHIYGCSSLSDFLQFSGGSFRGLVHPDDLEDVENSIKSQIYEEQSDLDYVEYRIIRKDGKIRWIDDYGHFIKSKGMGDIFYVFMTDVTDKKEHQRAEKALLIEQKNQSEAAIKTLVEEYDRERKLINQEHLRRLEVIEGLSVNYDTILYIDLEARTVFPYRQSNRVSMQFRGEAEPRDLVWYVNDYVDNAVHPDDREQIRSITDPEYMRKRLSEVNTYYTNYRGGLNGEYVHLQMRVVNVSPDNQVSQIVIGYRNIEEELQREQQHMQALENALKSAEQANKARTAFLSNMSHDLRTPLNAIFGYTMLAKTNIVNPSAVADYLNKIDTAGKQMYDLIAKLLELTYIQSNELKIQEAECNICDAVIDLFESRRAEAANKNIVFDLAYASVTHKLVFADAEKIKQMLGYLIGNAIKYTKRNGKVSVNVVEDGMCDGIAQFRFIISDTGIGISEQTKAHIFEPFVRENNTTASGVYGTGLGLTIAKSIVDMMGGSIEIESELDKGSKFTVTLGLKTVDHHEEKPFDEDAVIAQLEGKRILVVEDNEINLEIITDILESYGLVIDSAENGSIAVDIIKSKPRDYYSFILMDIQMPVMNGHEATVAIRKLDDKIKSHIPIIALSANAFESDKRKSLESGMNAHLTKPLDTDALFKTVAEVLNLN